MHALFDKTTAKNTWSIPANVLREFIDFFGPRTEQLDMYSENGRATFTSYTEKIMDGKGILVVYVSIQASDIDRDLEVLKQPLQTSVAVDTVDFESFSVEDKLHIGISVKDFRAIVTHAGTLKTSITARYSQPTRPLQLAYECGGMLCEFTLMTIGDFRGTSVTPGPSVSRGAPTRPSQREQTVPTLERNIEKPAKPAFPPPSQPASRIFTRENVSQRPNRPSPPITKPSIDAESLFLPPDDDDRQWDEKNYGDPNEDMLGWDVSADNVSQFAGFNSSL